MDKTKTIHAYLIGQPLREMVRIVTGLTRSTLDHSKLNIGLSGRMLARIKPLRAVEPKGSEKSGDEVLNALAKLLSYGPIGGDKKWPFETLPVSEDVAAVKLPGIDFVFDYMSEDKSALETREVRIFLVDDVNTMKAMAKADDPNGTDAYFPKVDNIERSILFMASTLHASSVSVTAKNEELLVGIASAVFTDGKSNVSSGILVLSPMELALLDRPIAVQKHAEAMDRWGANEYWSPGVLNVPNDIMAQILCRDIPVMPRNEIAKVYAVLTSEIIAERAVLGELLGILEDWRGSPPDRRSATGSAIMIGPYGVIEDGQLNLHSGSTPEVCIPLFDERGSVFADPEWARTPALMPQGGQMQHLALLMVHDPFFMAAFDLMSPWATDHQLVLDIKSSQTVVSY